MKIFFYLDKMINVKFRLNLRKFLQFLNILDLNLDFFELVGSSVDFWKF